ncbi:hypothetical protein SDC9_191423 [bioreactor metagenome]|uniref:Uncharacterized protein n=1 Tax=bioreactor metagenome TaxID=1076179 RepID=A0A645HZF0_9ZZZZ
MDFAVKTVLIHVPLAQLRHHVQILRIDIHKPNIQVPAKHGNTHEVCQ